MMKRSGIWGQWVGLLLGACQSVEDFNNNQDIFQHIVRIVKILVKADLQQFWNPNEELYYFQLIKDFIKDYIQDKGIKLWLPVFTKLLGTAKKS